MDALELRVDLLARRDEWSVLQQVGGRGRSWLAAGAASVPLLVSTVGAVPVPPSTCPTSGYYSHDHDHI